MAVRRILLMVLLFLTFTCKSEKQPEKRGSIQSGGSIAAGKEIDPAAHFDLTPETVVIRHASQIVRKISPDHSTFFLDGSKPDVQALAPGKVMLIAGLDAGKVTAVRKEGNDFVVSVGPVRITDVIRNGTIQWEAKDVDFSRARWIYQPSKLQQSSLAKPSIPSDPFHPDGFLNSTLYAQETNPEGEQQEPGTENQEPNPENQEKPEPPHQYKATVNVGAWKIEVTFIQPGTLRLYGARQLSSKKLARADEIRTLPWFILPASQPGSPQPEAGMKFYAGANVDINFGSLKPSGLIKVTNGQIRQYDLNMPADGYVELSANAKTDDSPVYVPRGIIEIPVEFSIPIDVGVPMYIGIKYNFFIQPEIPTKMSAISLKVRSDFHGNIKMNYTPDSSAPSQTAIQLSDPPDPIKEVTSTPSLGVITVLFAAQMPRISVGLGVTSALSAGLFWDWVHAITATVGSSTALLPCKSVTLNETISFGLEAELGPKWWKNLLNKIDPSNKTKVEFFKVPLWQKSLGPWYEPHVNLCKP